MNFLIFEHIQNATQSLRSNRLRTLLTTAGIAIGIASITSILALTGGVSKVIDDQIAGLNGNIAVIRPAAAASSINNLANPSLQQAYTASSLTETDLAAITSTPGVKAVAPLMLVSGNIKTNDQSTPKSINSTILATTPDLESIAQLPIRDGQFIDSVTNGDTAVVGAQLSIDLFGTSKSIGKTFSVKGQSFTVIGVLDYMKNPINYNAIDFDHTAIISFKSGKQFNQGIAQINQINVQADSTDNLPAVIGLVQAQLDKTHQNEQDFIVLSGDSISKPTADLFKAIAGLMTIFAAISLLVGGIGVMNIMLVGVAERTREIGLRKSVGASNTNIVWQFMTEALILSLIGGLIGYAAGYIVAFLISTMLPFNPAINWQIAAISLGTSVAIGCIFGLYPAIRAARKDPIESLRQYH